VAIRFILECVGEFQFSDQISSKLPTRSNARAERRPGSPFALKPRCRQQIAATAEISRSFVECEFGTRRAANGFRDVAPAATAQRVDGLDEE
jgi:hypothetical protein